MQKLLAFLIIGSLSFCSTLLKINDFNGGIDTATSPEKIKNNQFVDITNMNFGIAGSLQKRNGVTLNNALSDLDIVYTNTSNGLIRSVEVGTPSSLVPPRGNDSITYNGNLFIYGNNSYPAYINPLISFEGIITALGGRHVNSAIWKGSPVGDNQYSKLYLLSQNINISTASWGSINVTSIDLTISASATLVNGYFQWDLTNIINRMVDSGYYCLTTTTLNIGGTYTLPLDYGSIYGSSLTIKKSVLVNINEREASIVEPDEVFMFDDRVLYNSTILTASVQQYSNTLKDSYFFGLSGVDYTWNSYTNSFKRIGLPAPNKISYSSVALSGNLSGTYNYAVTYKYDNRYESNPALSQTQDSATQDYIFGVAYLRIGGFNYVFQQIDTAIYLTKTTTGNVFVETKKIANSETFFKAISTSQNIFFSTEEGFIYKINPLDLSISAIYSNVNIILGHTWRSPQFSIVNNQIFAFRYMSSSLVYNLYYLYYFNYVKLDFNLIETELVSRLYDSSYTRPNRQPTDFTCFDINSNGYVYSYWWDSLTNRMYNIHHIDFTWGNTVVPASDLTQSGISKVRGMDNSYNGFYNNNYGIINIVTPNTIITISTNMLVSSSDIIAGFDSGGVNVFSSSTSLDSKTSTTSTYQTSINVSIINGQMLITIPTSDSNRVMARNIYRQKNGTGYYLLETIADNTTTTYNDNISDQQQTVIALNQDNDIPPDAIDSAYNVARLFYLDANGTVWYSKINNPEAVPLLNYININTGTDDSPKRIIPFFSGLVVFFSKSIWYIDLSNQSTLTWVPRKLNVDFGCDYTNSITTGKLPDQSIGIFYLASDRSIRVLNGSMKNSVQLFDNIYTDSLSTPIQYDLEAITDNFTDVYGAYYKYNYYLSIPNQNKIWIYDTQVGGITKYTYPTKYKYIGVIDNQLLAGGYTSSSLYKLEDSTQLTDYGTPISWNIKTKIFADDFEINKDYSTIWFRGHQTATGNVLVNIKNNTDNWLKEQNITMNLMTTRNATIVTQKKKVLNSYGRDIQIEISGTPNVRIDDISLEIIPRSD